VPNHVERPDIPRATHGLPVDFYLIGSIDFGQAFSLQRRLAYEVGDVHRPRLAVLLCEHHDLITVGRGGSRAHIRWTNEQLMRQQVRIQWVGRGGGCIPHARGQIAIYPIVPLSLAGWTVGEFLRRFQRGIRAAVEQFHIHTMARDDEFGIWGNTGLLAAFGVAVRNWTTCHGGFLNVNPAMHVFRHVVTTDVDSPICGQSQMSSLMAERRAPITMHALRTAVIESLAEALECERLYVHSAHPALRPPDRGLTKIVG
jgi:lipoyl(octanoyl) transferase